PANKQTDDVSRSKAADDVVRAVMKTDALRVWSQAEDAFKSANYGTAEQAYSQLTTTYRDYISPQQLAQAEANLKTARKSLAAQPQSATPGQPEPAPPATEAPRKEPKWIADYTPPEQQPSGDDEADGILTLLSGSFSTDAKAATE